MDLLSLVTSGMNDNEVNGHDEDILGVVEGWEDDETHNPDVPAVSHKRGLTPFVFVPFEEVCDSFYFGSFGNIFSGVNKKLLLLLLFVKH